MAEESAVKVCVRVRPLIEREENAALENAEPVQLFWKADKKSIHQIDEGNSTKSFVFDRVFTADETTNQLYQDIAKPLVVSTVEGYNGTVFAYGQTSSGKTFTMMGSDRNHGVIPLAVEDVFQTIQNCPKKEFLLRVSYMEIYNETVSDLLVDSWKRKPLEVRETINKNIFVADLTEELVTSSTQALAWIRKGEKNRRYGKTKMNERSSRSHTIFRMILESRESSENAEGENADGAIIVSHLNLVDLAGSERTSQTGADGTRFKEGCNINRSLFTLSQVIKKLTDESQKGFTNYRDSKLTRILQNSLGGNAKTVIICTITPVALDETLSTLQFASTAKKMKNDPHVTEVSDDGALLKRYRNEIVDLKRRLTEVSSVTQTTATEKKVLSQLIQEKDQLQREQQDRIRNLTKLLVTSSNLVPVRKLPKRRVTWGGKMIRLGRPSACEGPSDLSFADSFTRKRKAESSCLMDLCEDDEDFDSQWEIPGEPSDDMDMSQSSVTVRSFGNSPKDFVSPDYIHKLSGKVSHLEHQLDIESLHKEEAMTRAEASDGRVAEMELQLQTDAHQKRETLEKMQRAAELELQLQTEAKEANEKVEMLTAERDYLKQEIGMFIEETERLENENAVLSEEMAEKKEMDEFRSLEEDFRKGHENDMQNEISELKRAVESSELQCLELQNKLETLSEELQKKTEFVKELQSMSGKDLVQEVATLRRSLNDAEGLSRDTKKEWAHLRSKNIAVEEMNVTLSANSKKMEAEVNGLRGKLETEKSRNRALQSDLQKELNVAFDENTKLTALLDGKVPKNLMDGVELERTVARLNRELTASHEAEGALRAQLEELASFQTLPDKVEDLTKQLNELTEELQRVRDEKDALLSEQRSSAEEAEQLLSTVASLTAERDQLTRNLQENVEMAAETQLLLQSLQEQSRNNSDLEKLSEQKESEFGEHILGLSQELQRVRDEKDALLSEQRSSAEEAEQLLSTVASLTAERDQLQTDMQDNVDMMIENQQELRTALDKTREQKERIAQLETAHTSKQEDSPSAQTEELQTLIQRLTEELEGVRAQRDGLSSERTADTRTSREETERLQSRVTSLSEERDQLQETLEALRQEKRQLRAELEDRMETFALAQSGFNQPEKLTSEPQPHDEDVTRLQQEINELQATLQAVTEQKSQLEVDLQRNVQTAVETQVLQSLQAELQEQKQLYSDHMTLCEQKESDLDQQTETLTEQLESARAERDALLAKESVCQASREETERLQSRVTSLSEERDQLQETLEALRQEKRQLRAELEDQMETFALAQSGFNQPEKLTSEPQPHDEDVTRLQQEINELQATLQAVTEQKSQLEVDLQRNVQTAVETQVLQSLQAELQEQKQLYSDHMTLCEQKESDLDQQTETLTEQLESARAERDALLAKESVCQASREETERLQSRVTSLSEERDQLQETLEALRQEKRQLRAELEDRMETFALAQSGFNQPEKLTSEPQPHDEDVTRLQQEINELQATLQTVTEQKSQLEVDLQRNVQTAVETQVLQSLQAELQEQKQLYSDHMTLCEQKESDLDQQTETLTEQLESARAERDALLAKESVCQTSREETERLQSRVTSLSEERDQLQETLEALRQEKRQLRAELEDQMETFALAQSGFNQPEKLTSEPQPHDEDVTRLQQEINELQATLQAVTEQKSQLEVDLQRNVQTAVETQVLQSLQAELQEQKQLYSDHMTLCEQKESDLDQQTETLTEQLESARAERDAMLAKESVCQASREETERLQSRVTSLSEERDQLQETLEALRQEKRQLRAELEDRMETVQTEVTRLNASLQTVSEQRRRLEEDLQRSVNTASSTQELVKSLEEELCEQKQENSDLERLLQEKERSLDRQMSTLTEKLQLVEAERDALLSEKDAGCRASREETERLQSRVTSLSEERDQLQETLEALRQEKRQLRAELEDRMETISVVQEKLSEQERNQREMQQTVQQLEEQLRLNKRIRSRARVEADASQQLLGDATATVSALGDQASGSDPSASGLEDTPSSRLQDSTRQLQESLRRFQTFIDLCAKQNANVLVNVEDDLSYLPKPTSDAFSAVSQLERQMSQTLGDFTERVQARAECYRNLFEQLAKKDLAVFEQSRLQDVLLCRAQEEDQDVHALRGGRLAELLAKRQLQLQKMSNVLEALRATMVSYADKLSAELGVKERFKERLTAFFSRQYSDSKLLGILTSELDHRSAMAHTTKTTLQAIMDKLNGPCEELKQLEAQADARLREESSKTSSLLQALEGAPLKTDRQQLVLQLQQTKETIKALHVHIEQLEEARLKASSRVSNHKEATQLLQTELQDSRAQVQEKDHAIQSLKSKLRQSEKNASPSAVELENLRTKLFKVELQLSSASDEHKRDIQKMSSLLSEKEEYVRKLKETLRKTQQEGEDSFLQGEDLHARLTNPRGSVIKTSIQLENTKLEEEVKRLQLKISELESSLSSSRDDIGKWKRKAVMLRVKGKAELDKPSSPCTPTKRGLSVTSDASNFFGSPKKLAVAPRKVPDSPTVSLPDSPKSRFSDLLSRSYPKQFFDNSNLGLVPEAAPAERKEDWWPMSPKQEEMCKTQ
ncbi:centromere-associated protein E isoform X1 [Cyclopterus lumpus]|uniref:centromere-associated protein E isoform X1 n=1 Tax=Cyclopterus lumpus TaxID=8103 RepID=UPI0014871AD7|nr:centromere-associated protein E isoform X1 [Cyclopterus lumpus]